MTLLLINIDVEAWALDNESLVMIMVYHWLRPSIRKGHRIILNLGFFLVLLCFLSDDVSNVYRNMMND